MTIFSWIILGLIAGAIAKLIMPGKVEPKGCLGTIILGIVGAVVGGFIGSHFFGTGKVDDWSFGSLGLSIFGAILVLWVFSMISGRK